MKTIPFTAAHTNIAHIWQYPPPPGLRIFYYEPYRSKLNQISKDLSICKDGPRDKGIQFCFNSTNSGVQATVEMKDFGVQVNLPLLTAEDLKEDDLKTRFYTGFVNFGTLMVIFNSLSPITGKLNYWNGKDSLKEKEYLENDVKQKPDPQRKMRLLDELLLVFMRLRLGLLEQDLAQRFCVSVSTVSRVLITWYNVLAANLKHLIVWPSKEVIATNMPDCFKNFPIHD